MWLVDGGPGGDGEELGHGAGEQSDHFAQEL